MLLLACEFFQTYDFGDKGMYFQMWWSTTINMVLLESNVFCAFRYQVCDKAIYF